MVFHLGLSDSKSPQVYWTLLSILAVLINAVVWMVSTRLPASKSSSPFNNPLVTLPKSTNHNCRLHVPLFFQFPSRAVVIILLFTFSHFSFIQWSAGRANSTILQIFFFLLIIFRFGLLAEIWRSVCMSKSHRSLCVSFSRTDAGLCIHHLFVWSNLNFLHISLWITSCI